MRYQILLVCLFSIFYACGNNSKTENDTTNNNKTTQNQVPLIEFKGWTEQKQAEYLNKLDEQERFKYIVVFLKDAVIFMPPNDWVKFNTNGDISDHHSISRTNSYGVIGKWSFENGQINITSVADGKGMEEIFGAKQFTWKKVTAEAPQNISLRYLDLISMMVFYCNMQSKIKNNF